MARIFLLGLIAVATIGALELGRRLVEQGRELWAMIGLIPIGIWVLELLAPGSQLGLGPLVETRVDWALEGALLGLFVLPVLIGYVAGLVWGLIARNQGKGK